MKKITYLIFIFFSLPTWACLNLSGRLSFNQKEVQINQKFSLNKEILLHQGNTHFHLVIKEFEAKKYLITVNIKEKDGLKLKDVGSAQIMVKENLEAEMIKEDPEKKEITKLNLKVSKI